MQKRYKHGKSALTIASLMLNVDVDCRYSLGLSLQIAEVIYQTRGTVFHRDIQTPRRELKIPRAAEYF